MKLERVGRGYEFNIWFLEKNETNPEAVFEAIQGDESGALSITSDRIRSAV